MKISSILFLLISISSFSQITLEDIWVDYKFYPRTISAPYWNSNETYLELAGKNSVSPNIYQVNINDIQNRKIILKQDIYEEYLKITFKNNKNLNLEDFAVHNFILSPNNKTILLEIGTENVYRYSSKSNFVIYDIDKKTITPIVTPAKSYYPKYSNNGKIFKQFYWS